MTRGLVAALAHLAAATPHGGAWTRGTTEPIPRYEQNARNVYRELGARERRLPWVSRRW